MKKDYWGETSRKNIKDDNTEDMFFTFRKIKV